MNIMNVLGLLGGLGLFLYGMKLMGEGLELAAGSRLRKLLEALTSNRLLGALVGFLITAIIQSSSATTVMVVGFVNAGLMNLAQAAGVIMGANIGTTVTGLIIALKLSDIAPLAIFLGVVLIMFAKKKNWQHIGTVLAGFGILFIGMSTMSEAMKPLQEMQGLATLFSYTKNPIIGILVGAAITALIQSSSASLGILITMAGLGIVSLDQAIYILYGQNIGTCITAIIASIGATKTAKRAAAIHLMFNIIGTAIFVIITMLLPFVPFVQSLSSDPKQQFAFAHIIFNIVTTILLLPCSNILVKLSETIISGEDPQAEKMNLQYLDERILNTPPFAVAQVIKEVRRMGAIAENNINLSLDSVYEHNRELVQQVYSNEKVINFLNHQITAYLVKLSALDLSPNDNKTVGSLFHVVNDIERIGDHAENIAEAAENLLNNQMSLSHGALAELHEMTAMVQGLLKDTLDIFSAPVVKQEEIEAISQGEKEIDNKTKELKNHHVDRLTTHECSPALGMLFVDLITNLERVADHATNIAYSCSDRATVLE